MAQELHQNLRRLNKINLLIVLYKARWLYLKQKTQMPKAIIFSLLASMFIFLQLSIFPHHPLAIPAAIGGGLAGGLLLMGGRYEKSNSQHQ